MRGEHPKILFVGDAWLGSNARSLANGFREAGATTIQIDTTPISRPKRLSPSWIYLKTGGRRSPGTLAAVHEQIERLAAVERPDVLFCFKTIHLDQDRLLGLPIRTKVHYSADDVSNPINTTPEYMKREHEWDLIVTTKRHNVDEVRERTGREPLFIWSAYDRAWHHPFAQNSESLALVSFIGNMRPDRRDFMVDLAEKYGGGLRLLGPGWSSIPQLRRSPAFVGRGVYGEEFSREVARSRAHLILLNSDNRDTHTCRSFEVPAAGGLFVGQRTSEHQQLIDDGETGYLFGDADELHDIIDRVSSEPDRSAKIAWRGYEQMANGKNDYRARAEEILRHLDYAGGMRA